MIAAIVLPTAVMTLPPGMVGEAVQHAWLSAVVATLCGLGIVALAAAISRSAPGITLIGVTSRHLGAPGRWIVGALYTWWLLHVNALILRSVSEFVVIILLPRTPVVVVAASLTALVLWAVRGGIESVARLATLTLPLVPLSVLLISLLSSQDFDLGRLAPLLPTEGIRPILRGAVAPASFFGEVIIASIAIFPFLNDPKRMLRSGIVGVLMTGVSLVVVLLVSVMVLGPASASADEFSFIRVVRLVSIGEFLQRTEGVFAVFWLFAMLVKLMIWFYATVFTGAEWLGLKTYHPLTIPCAVGTVGLALLLHRNIIEFRAFVATTWTPYAAVFELVIPMLLLLIALGIKKARERGSSMPRVPQMRQAKR